MFERIAIKEINKNCADKLRILFDLKSQQGKKFVDKKEIFIKSPKFAQERSKTPSDLMFYGVRPGRGWKSPGAGSKNAGIGRRFERFYENRDKKRNISNELLDGIDAEIRDKHSYRMNKPGRLKFMHARKKPALVSLHKISIFDGTVPESIIIESKSPVIKK